MARFDASLFIDGDEEVSVHDRADFCIVLVGTAPVVFRSREAATLWLIRVIDILDETPEVGDAEEQHSQAAPD